MSGSRSGRRPGSEACRPQPRPRWEKGKGKGKKGQGGKGQAAIPAAEMMWFQSLPNWGTKSNGGLRCCYYNSSVGCLNPACNFVDLCLVCGQGHPAVGIYQIGDPQKA